MENLKKKVTDEALRFIREHRNCSVSGCYASPRLSSELPDCSMPLTFDQYNYCSLGCVYCFAYYFKSNNPAMAGKENTLKAVDPKRLLRAMGGDPRSSHEKMMWEHFYHRKFLLHWGGLADPFCSFEKTNRVGLELIDGLGKMNYPTLFSFKGGTIFQPEYQDVFREYKGQSNFAFQASIITGDDELAKQVEIGVPSPSKRLEAIHMLSRCGYWTILRLRPYIIGISDRGIDKLLTDALAAGIRGVSMEFFAMDGRSNIGMKTRYEWIGKLIGVRDLHEYFVKLSPSERGGYKRLNRLVKEQHVKRVYQFCAKHGLVFGCSDPDFKELNTSGSCCAMPDTFDKNHSLENWTRSQLTYHLKEARKTFHTTGVRPVLSFSTVYSNESYLTDPRFGMDHPCVVGMPEAERRLLQPIYILQETWNNLRSPANPRNYLHGKVLPIDTDSDGNLLYRYNPSEYEEQWVKEGMDLTL